jgi:hypothetical protein
MIKRSNDTGYSLSGFVLVMCYSIYGLSDHLRYTAGLLYVGFGPITRQQHFIDALDGVFQDPIRVPLVGNRKEISDACILLFHRLASRYRHHPAGRLHRMHRSDYYNGHCDHESPPNHQGKPGTKRDRGCGSTKPSIQKIISPHRLLNQYGAGCDGDDHDGWHLLHPGSLTNKGGSSPANPLPGCPFS